MGPDEPAKVTAAHLRRAATLCRRRLAHEHAGGRGNRRASARFEVDTRLREDARLAHTDLHRPERRWFPTPTDLFPEQRRLYEAAATGYLALFGDRAARAVDPVDRWQTAVPALGIRLVGGVGLPLELDDGAREVRVLHLGRSGRPLLDEVDVGFLALRLGDWAAAGPVRLVGADLVEGLLTEVVVEPTELAAHHDWLADRVAAIRERVAEPRPRAGADCAGCAFVAGCPPHRDA